MALKHGVRSTTASSVVLGPGKAYANYENGTGTLLGATVGGGTWEVVRTKYHIMPDGAKGKIKGLGFFETVEAKATLNLLEATKTNLEKIIAAVNTTAFADGEAVGTGDGSTTVFELDNSADGGESAVFIDGTKQTSGYTISGTSLSFTTAPDSGAAITADYSYAGTPASGDFWRFRGDGAIADADYLTNIAIVCEYTGDSTDGAILIIENPLAEGGLTLGLPTGQEEMVHPVTWEAYYDDSDLDTEPWMYLLPE